VPFDLEKIILNCSIEREKASALYDAGQLHNKLERRHKKIWNSGDIEMSKITDRN
jgi:hypothetical protein